jgi:hypothetical protein
MKLFSHLFRYKFATILDLEPNWQLFGEMNFFNKNFGYLMSSLSIKRAPLAGYRLDLTANRKIMNSRISKDGFALLSLFYKIDTIHSLDIRPARNALKLERDKFNNLIHNSMIILTQRTMHGRRVFSIRHSIFVFLYSYETTPKWHSFFFDQTGRSRPEAALI